MPLIRTCDRCHAVLPTYEGSHDIITVETISWTFAKNKWLICLSCYHVLVSFMKIDEKAKAI